MPSSTERLDPWERLRNGNRRWVAGKSGAGIGRGAVRRAETSESQHPFALILGCSDSRLPAEILFDQGIGDLFVVRTAGHVLDGAVIGSIEYAVEILGVPLLVVLGHDGCGAVAAATGVVDGAGLPPGHIREIAERITPDVLRARRHGAETPAEVAGQHALFTVEQLRDRSTIIDAAIRRGQLAARPALYHLDSGTVTEAHPFALVPA